MTIASSGRKDSVPVHTREKRKVLYLHHQEHDRRNDVRFASALSFSPE